MITSIGPLRTVRIWTGHHRGWYSGRPRWARGRKRWWRESLKRSRIGDGVSIMPGDHPPGAALSVSRVEAAAERALLTGAVSYRSMDSILRHNLDQQPHNHRLRRVLLPNTTTSAARLLE